MSLISKAYASGLGFANAPANFKIQDINLFISSLISLTFIIAGILTFAFLVWGGIDWLTSGGDKTKTETARNRITSALVGLAIVATAWAVMKLIGVFFGIDLFGGTINIPTPYTRG
jgi:hypothetical protein